MMAERDRPMWKDHACRYGDLVRDPRTGDEYRVLELIGRGSYAEVYRAESVATGAPFALKVLQIHREVSQKTRQRHQREGEMLLRLRDRNLVRVHAIIEAGDGRMFMVMDLLVGRTLSRLRVDCGGKLPINTAVEIALQVCSALEAVHELKVIHRDIKPDNIFVGDDGIVRLCDLGVSHFSHETRITTEDTTIGTVEYMSPEQFCSPNLIGPCSDLFGLGVVLYESIAGVSPWAVEGKVSANVKELAMQILLRPHTPLVVAAPETPKFIAAVVECLLGKEPADRYESAAVACDVLEAALATYMLELAAQNVAPPRILVRRQAAPGAPHRHRPGAGPPRFGEPFRERLRAAAGAHGRERCRPACCRATSGCTCAHGRSYRLAPSKPVVRRSMSFRSSAQQGRLGSLPAARPSGWRSPRPGPARSNASRASRAP